MLRNNTLIAAPKASQTWESRDSDPLIDWVPDTFRYIRVPSLSWGDRIAGIRRWNGHSDCMTISLPLIRISFHSIIQCTRSPKEGTLVGRWALRYTFEIIFGIEFIVRFEWIRQRFYSNVNTTRRFSRKILSNIDFTVVIHPLRFHYTRIVQNSLKMIRWTQYRRLVIHSHHNVEDIVDKSLHNSIAFLCFRKAEFSGSAMVQGLASKKFDNFVFANW